MIKRLFAGLLLAAVASTLIPLPAWAQAGTPGGTSRVRVFGGFSYLRVSTSGTEEIPELAENAYGVQGNLVYYFHPRVGFMVDGAFNSANLLREDLDVPNEVTGVDLNQTTLLFGPSFVLANSGRLTAQAYGTVGWAIASIDVTGIDVVVNRVDILRLHPLVDAHERLKLLIIGGVRGGE